MVTDADDWTGLTDLAARTLGGSVVAANDEAFAERENLIRPYPVAHDPAAFGPKGKVYDGWETRRRRTPGEDWAIVRLATPGVVHGVVVDTAYFRGNYPPEISVQGTVVDEHLPPAAIAASEWVELVPRSPAAGDSVNRYDVTYRGRVTHVRLVQHPDGGVARLRVHGVVVPDPRFLTGTVDLLAAEHGGVVVAASNAFYSSPANLLRPDRARHMGEGWENARRRGPGHDFVVFGLAARGALRHLEVDTSYFVHNAPGEIRVEAADGADPPTADNGWWEVVARRPVLPDTRHRFLVDAGRAARWLRLSVFPDGGLARFRAYGEVEPAELDRLRRRWADPTAPG